MPTHNLLRGEFSDCAPFEVNDNLLELVTVIFAGRPRSRGDDADRANRAGVFALPAVVHGHRPQGGQDQRHQGNSNQAMP